MHLVMKFVGFFGRDKNRTPETTKGEASRTAGRNTTTTASRQRVSHAVLEAAKVPIREDENENEKVVVGSNKDADADLYASLVRPSQ